MTDAGARAMPRGPVGIGGWLILPILHLISRLSHSISIAVADLPIAVTTSHLTDIGEIQADIARAELIGVLLAGGFCLYCLVLMFRKSRRLPAAMIAFYCANLMIAAASAIGCARHVITCEGEPYKSFFGGMEPEGCFLAAALFNAFILIPYFLVSKRVKNTFVN